MTVTTRPTYLTEAEFWADSLWTAAETRWSERTGQDKNYRTRVIHPFLADLIADLVPSAPRTILDLGCGDGVLANDDRCIGLTGPGGRYLGVDINPGLLDRAGDTTNLCAVSLIRMNLTDRALPEAVLTAAAAWDVVVSVFVVQEIADIGAFFENLARLLTHNTHAVIITVHPQFADWLREQGRLMVEDRLAGTGAPWRWAGRYPIVDEARGTFYLPHFQRTVEDYHGLAAGAGLVIRRTLDIPCTADALATFRKEGFPPFRDYPENAYWPAIGEMPSSIALIIGRERTDG